ncbi:MAG: 2-amino-4-hydroxy-6-hydroxymethyldihydropteridine diphosphokinase [Planctomycetota bacterium]
MSKQQGQVVLLSLGSNIGGRRAHMAAGIDALLALPGMTFLKVSRLYETEAWGGPEGQGSFLNAALLLRSEHLSPMALLTEILKIEAAEGRVREITNGPRTLDIDILLWGQSTVKIDHLQIPHVGLHERSFVLQPAAEIAGDMDHPLAQSTIAELCQRVGSNGLIQIIQERGWYHALGQSTCQ